MVFWESKLYSLLKVVQKAYSLNIDTVVSPFGATLKALWLGLLSKIGLADTMVESVSMIDGLRVNLACGNIVHLRSSGNVPEQRCYAEADIEAKAQSLVNKVLNHVQALAS